MGTPDDEPEQTDDRAVGRTGARFPSARARRHSAGHDAGGPGPGPGEPEQRADPAEPERPGNRKSRRPVGRSGARFPRPAPGDDVPAPGSPNAGHPGTGHPEDEFLDAEFADADAMESGAMEPGTTDVGEPGTPPGPPRPSRLRDQGVRPARIVMSPRTPGEDTDPGSPVARLRARPYVLTKGRTQARADLAVETLISADPRAPWNSRSLSAEYRAVRELCAQPRSVAEVAATLSVPLGVARVMLSDLADAGFVHVHTVTHTRSGRPDHALMRRVLNGLHRL